nr:MAG TPA: hypothetical protein [Caudoviricetes sp.]
MSHYIINFHCLPTMFSLSYVERLRQQSFLKGLIHEK